MKLPLCNLQGHLNKNEEDGEENTLLKFQDNSHIKLLISLTIPFFVPFFFVFNPLPTILGKQNVNSESELAEVVERSGCVCKEELGIS